MKLLIINMIKAEIKRIEARLNFNQNGIFRLFNLFLLTPVLSYNMPRVQAKCKLAFAAGFIVLTLSGLQVIFFSHDIIYCINNFFRREYVAV